MDETKIVAFVTSRCERLNDDIRGPSYRCSATLTDGTFLPCVVIGSKEAQVRLALRRFDETRADGTTWFGRRSYGKGFDYASVVESFVTAGNHLNHYDIASLRETDFALPVAILNQIQGETSMAWTQFTGTMRDGLEFSFGTTFHFEFFSMPPGYTARDIRSIISHKRLEGELFRERPFFTCFVHGL
jgi:hypothetical protein